MDVTGIIGEYADYGLWATEQVLDRLEKEPGEVLDERVKSSFPTLRDTLLHIRNADHVWLCRLQQRPHSWPAEEDGSLATVRTHAKAFHDHVISLDAHQLARDRTYSDLSGNAHQQHTWQMVMHCVNHASYHRGQVVTIMHQLGLTDIPATDLIRYQRQMS